MILWLHLAEQARDGLYVVVQDLRARGYLRHPEHLEAARRAVAADLPDLDSAIFLRADVCRRELLVEIEATGLLR